MLFSISPRATKFQRRSLGLFARLWRIVWLGLAVAVHSNLGCGSKNECDFGDDRCDGAVARRCGVQYSSTSAPRVWKFEDCGLQGKVCVLCSPEYGAQCAAGDRLDSRCDQERAYCDGNLRVSCDDCAESHKEACGALFCVRTHMGTSATENSAICALAPTRDSRCPAVPLGAPAEPTFYCDGSRLVRCLDGYATDALDCPKGCGTTAPATQPTCLK
jgi:hypothetical protein